MANLTTAQRLILSRLARLKESECPPTGPEISEALGHASYWASGKIASLEKRGLVERLGQSFTGGNCFRITPAGRASLSKQEE